MFELDEDEAKELYDHLIERQEGCFFIGEIAYIFGKLEKYLLSKGIIEKEDAKNSYE